MVKPGDDAAVIRVDDQRAFAITADCNSIQTKLDPYQGGAGAVAEAIRNVVSMGAEPLCMVDCFNFGNPEKPEVFWQFKECVQGMADVARRFQTPVISGNVSFYNETEGVTVNPSPVVSVAGLMDIKDIRTFEFKNSGDKIILLGTTRGELDGSEYHNAVHGVVQGKPPEVFLEEEFAVADEILKLIKEDVEGNITAVHDCSAGGLSVALSEMALSGNLGAEISLSQVPGAHGLKDMELLFSESHGRYILTVREDAVNDVLAKIQVPASVIGEVHGDALIINEASFKIPVAKIKESYQGVIEKFMA